LAYDNNKGRRAPDLANQTDYYKKKEKNLKEHGKTFLIPKSLPYPKFN
jgi:hypothetical protein